MAGPSPIIIDFIVKDLDKVLNAMKSISAAVMKTEQHSVAAARAKSTERVRIAEQESRKKISNALQAERMTQAAEQAGLRSTTNRFKAEAAARRQDLQAHIAIARQKETEAKTAARRDLQAHVAISKQKEAVARAAANQQVKLARQLALEEKRAHFEIRRGAGAVANPAASPQARLMALKQAKSKSHEEQARILEKVQGLRGDAAGERAKFKKIERAHKASEEQMTRDAETEHKRRQAIRDRSAQMAGQYAAQQARIEARELRKQTNEQTHINRRFVSNAVGAGGTAIKNATSIVGNVGHRVLDGAFQIGGGFSLADSVQRKVSMRGNLADISNRALIPGDPENSKRVSVDDLQSDVRGVGARWGIDPEKATAGLDKFAAKTGNLKRGRELLSGLAEMSRAGAGDLDDLADAAGDVFNADHKQNAEDILKTMRALSGQGKIGAVEMKDLATQMAALQAAGTRFEGNAGENMVKMGALAQLSRSQGGSRTAAQATQAVTSLSAQLYKEKRIEGLEHLGVQVKDEKTGDNKSMDSIIFAALTGAEKRSREKGHGMKDFDVMMTGAFKDQQAQRAVLPFMKAYKAEGGGEKGLAAAKKMFQDQIEASQSVEEIHRLAAERMKETDAQLEIAMQKLRNTTADELTPALQKLVPIITQLVPPLASLLNGLVRIADWASKNPFEGFGALVSAFFLAELAKAQVAETIKNVLNGVGSGARPSITPGGVPGAAGGVGGAGAAELGLIGAGSAVQIGSMTSLADERYGAVSSGQDQAKKLAVDMASGDPKKIAAAKAAYAQAQSKGSSAETAYAYVDTATRGAMTALNPLGYLSSKAGDYAAQKIGGQSSSQRSVEALKAHEIVNAEELKKSIANAVTDGVRDGMAVRQPTSFNRDGGSIATRNPPKP